MKVQQALLAFVLALATLLTGCGLPSRPATPGDIPENTQLAISPNGKRLLVSWRDRAGKTRAKLVELAGTKVATVRDFPLPQDIMSTAFANSNEQLLVTTWDREKSDLLKINTADAQTELIYSSRYPKRFPLEVSSGNYVFLEGKDIGEGYSQWQRYWQGEKTLVNEKSYGMATNLSVVGESLFLLEPWTPPAFRNIHGPLPARLGSMINAATFHIVCADRTPLICVRDHLFHDPDPYAPSYYYSVIELINGSRKCVIPGRWIDRRELKISRDGSTVVFHAAIKELHGERAIYVVKNAPPNCTAEAVEIK